MTRCEEVQELGHHKQQITLEVTSTGI